MTCALYPQKMCYCIFALLICSDSGLDGLALFGLNHPAVVYLIEQLYGAHNCTNYRFKYHLYEQDAEVCIDVY